MSNSIHKKDLNRLISGARQIAQGAYDFRIQIDRDDDIGHLAQSINEMGREIGLKQGELNERREELSNLFELAPCYITVQDKDFKLLKYNREFERMFAPKPGDYCYKAYKNRSERCEVCPLVETFEDGKMHTSEESGINKDGTRSFWRVRTSPIKNSEGEVVAAMEMCLDVTQMKFLEDEVRRSEKKYRTIFHTIPNPVFVLDEKTLDILDCNDRIKAVYGFEKEEILGTSFCNLFEADERERYTREMKGSKDLNQIRQIRKDGKAIFVNISISSSEYNGRNVFLVTTSDITLKLIAEQHIIQASKMATLGEMATGVAHELNQPLSVIKTASNFILKKVQKKEPIEDEIIETLAAEMDNHVDRASNIINHMREFGRQSDAKRVEVHVNEILVKSLAIFSKQMKLRQIELVMDLEEDLPPIKADSNRLEQVFINLLTNARDAIEEKGKSADYPGGEKRITLKTRVKKGMLCVEVKDTGAGIPEAIRERIFDPFFTTKKAGKGTGLGLSISYGIIREYEGTITVESHKGEGSVFLIEFPISGTE
jgi:histidine kinase